MTDAAEIADGGTEQVRVDRDVLEELVDTAKGKLETDFSQQIREKAGYDVDAFTAKIERAEEALERDEVVDEAPWDWQVRSTAATHLYQDAIHTWGEQAQIAKASEECSELAAVLAGDLNGQANVAELLQEIVDVRIMLEQLARTIGLGQDDLEAEVTTRLQYLDQRLDGGDETDE